MSLKEQQAEVEFSKGIERIHHREERFVADLAKQAKKKAKTAAKKAKKKRKDRAAKKAAAAAEEELLANGEVEGGTVSLIDSFDPVILHLLTFLFMSPRQLQVEC